jgi:hypothetical protein
MTEVNYLPPKTRTGDTEVVPAGKMVVVSTDTMTGEEMTAWVDAVPEVTPGWLMLHYLSEMRRHDQEYAACSGAGHDSSKVTMLAGGDEFGVVWATLRDANPFLSCLIFIHAYKPR